MRIALPICLFLALFASPYATGQTTSVVTIATPGGPMTTVVRSGWIGPMSVGPTLDDLLENGDFSSGLDGWTATESGGALTPGSVSPVAEAAQFLEGDSFLVTLSQTFTVPGFATELRFDLIVDPGFDTAAQFIPDAFECTLLDASGFPAAEPWILGASSAFNMQEDGTVNMGAGVTFDGTTAVIDVSTVPAGELLTLYFDFVNGDLDTAGGVQIDNAQFLIDLPPGSFFRGDVDNDGSVTTLDEGALLDYLFAGGIAPLDCLGLELPEVGDANDNEWTTVADYLRLRNANAQGQTLPQPSTFCGVDLTIDQAGFDVLDPAYRATAGDVVVDPPTGPTDRDVFIPILIDVPQDVIGLTLILNYDDSLLTPFDPLAGDGDPFESTLGTTAVLAAPGQLVIALWATNDGDTLLSGAPGLLQSIGSLQFHLDDFVVLPSPSWSTETTLGALSYRATIVDASFGDHHPELLAGEGEFARGDANNDGAVQISDVVYTLDYLFVGGPSFDCWDAADSNNDSDVQISDPVYSLSFLFVGGPPPPLPYPGCGEDIGPIDALDCQTSACQLP